MGVVSASVVSSLIRVGRGCGRARTRGRKCDAGVLGGVRMWRLRGCVTIMVIVVIVVVAIVISIVVRRRGNVRGGGTWSCEGVVCSKECAWRGDLYPVLSRRLEERRRSGIGGSGGMGESVVRRKEPGVG